MVKSVYGPAPTDPTISLQKGQHPQRHDEVWEYIDTKLPLLPSGGDDTAAIKAAHSAGRELGAGTFSISGPIEGFVGQGETRTTIRLANGANAAMVAVTGRAGVVMLGATLDGNKANQTANVDAVVLTTCDDALVERVRILNPSRIALRFNGCQRARVLNNEIIGVPAAAFASMFFGENGSVGCSDARVIGNALRDCPSSNGIQFRAGATFLCNRNLIADNNLIGVGGVPIEHMWGDDLVVTGNHISGAGTNGISVGTGLGHTIANNTVRDQSKWGIELARIDFGSVVGNFVDGSGTTNTGISLHGSVEVANTACNYCTVSGNTIRNIEQAAGCFGIAVAPTGAASSFGNVIVGNTLVDAGEVAIMLNRGTTTGTDMAQYVTIEGNSIHLTGASALAARQAMRLVATLATAIKGNTIRATAAAGVLITLNTSNRTTIEGNIIDGGAVATRGIQAVSGGGRHVVLGNVITNIAGTAIDTAGATVNTIGFNEVLGNTSDYSVSTTDQDFRRNAPGDNLTRVFSQLRLQGGATMKTKAGAVVDGDFASAIDGNIAVDITNHRLYVRSGGTWKSVAVA